MFCNWEKQQGLGHSFVKRSLGLQGEWSSYRTSLVRLDSKESCSCFRSYAFATANIPTPLLLSFHSALTFLLNDCMTLEWEGFIPIEHSFSHLENEDLRLAQCFQKHLFCWHIFKRCCSCKYRLLCTQI